MAVTPVPNRAVPQCEVHKASAPRGRGGTGPNAFSDAVLRHLDRAVADIARSDVDGRFVGTTIRRSASGFNEFGFFTPTTVLPPAQVGSDGGAGEVGREPALTQVGLAGNVATPSLPVHEVEIAIPDARPNAQAEQNSPASQGGVLARPARSSPRVNLAGEPMLNPPDLFSLPLVVRRDTLARQARSAPMVDRLAVPAASDRPALRVAIARTDAGLVITVQADGIDADESLRMRREVAGLLARHGLVLSDLKVNGADASHRYGHQGEG